MLVYHPISDKAFVLTPFHFLHSFNSYNQNMKILVLNCGSSSIKYKLYDMKDESVLAQGGVERIGLDEAFIMVRRNKSWQTFLHIKKV